jgi:hypothetical protein
MPPDESHPVREKLEKTEHRLEAALGEVCDDLTQGGVKKPDTSELIRMDETLTLAAQAAKQAILLRRQLRRAEKEAQNEKDAKKPAKGAKGAKDTTGPPDESGDQPTSGTG